MNTKIDNSDIAILCVVPFCINLCFHNEHLKFSKFPFPLFYYYTDIKAMMITVIILETC